MEEWLIIKLFEADKRLKVREAFRDEYRKKPKWTQSSIPGIGGIIESKPIIRKENQSNPLRSGKNEKTDGI